MLLHLLFRTWELRLEVEVISLLDHQNLFFYRRIFCRFSHFSICQRQCFAESNSTSFGLFRSLEISNVRAIVYNLIGVPIAAGAIYPFGARLDASWAALLMALRYGSISCSYWFQFCFGCSLKNLTEIKNETSLYELYRTKNYKPESISGTYVITMLTSGNEIPHCVHCNPTTLYIA